MDIVAPPRPPSEVALGADLTEALRRLDGCPKCVHNTELPFAAIPNGDGWLCRYRCTDCRHSWSTCWAVG